VVVFGRGGSHFSTRPIQRKLTASIEHSNADFRTVGHFANFRQFSKTDFFNSIGSKRAFAAGLFNDGCAGHSKPKFGKIK